MARRDTLCSMCGMVAVSTGNSDMVRECDQRSCNEGGQFARGWDWSVMS